MHNRRIRSVIKFNIGMLLLAIYLVVTVYKENLIQNLGGWVPIASYPLLVIGAILVFKSMEDTSEHE